MMRTNETSRAIPASKTWFATPESARRFDWESFRPSDCRTKLVSRYPPPVRGDLSFREGLPGRSALRPFDHRTPSEAPLFERAYVVFPWERPGADDQHPGSVPVLPSFSEPAATARTVPENYPRSSSEGPRPASRLRTTKGDLRRPVGVKGHILAGRRETRYGGGAVVGHAGPPARGSGGGVRNRTNGGPTA
jgi:hypothetical protein